MIDIKSMVEKETSKIKSESVSISEISNLLVSVLSAYNAEIQKQLTTDTISNKASGRLLETFNRKGIH